MYLVLYYIVDNAKQLKGDIMKIKFFADAPIFTTTESVYTDMENSWYLIEDIEVAENADLVGKIKSMLICIISFGKDKAKYIKVQYGNGVITKTITIPLQIEYVDMVADDIVKMIK